MSRARSAVAARTPIDTLRQKALDAFGYTQRVESDERFEDFFDVSTFCRPLTEELGGEIGCDGWYLWQHGEWAILGDLGMNLPRNHAALEALSAALGEVVVGAVDAPFEYAHFAIYRQGKMRRRLELEDGAYLTEGLPLETERGRQPVDFTEEEAERLWTSYGLPTFEYDPLEGPFACFGVNRGE